MTDEKDKLRCTGKVAVPRFDALSDKVCHFRDCHFPIFLQVEARGLFVFSWQHAEVALLVVQLCVLVFILRMEVQRHIQCNLYIYMYHMYFGSRIKRLEKVRFPFRRYAAYGSSVIASNFAD